MFNPDMPWSNACIISLCCLVAVGIWRMKAVKAGAKPWPWSLCVLLALAPVFLGFQAVNKEFGKADREALQNGLRVQGVVAQVETKDNRESIKDKLFGLLLGTPAVIWELQVDYTQPEGARYQISQSTTSAYKVGDKVEVAIHPDGVPMFRDRPGQVHSVIVAPADNLPFSRRGWIILAILVWAVLFNLLRGAQNKEDDEVPRHRARSTTSNASVLWRLGLGLALTIFIVMQDKSAREIWVSRAQRLTAFIVTQDRNDTPPVPPSPPKVAADNARSQYPPLKAQQDDIYAFHPRLITERLDAILPGDAGVPEMFFLGLGGVDEDVFLRETRSVKALFDERFNTYGRSLLLVTNRATVKELPLATRDALARSLIRMGKRMNGAEDLLFLFLTSHGARDHRLLMEAQDSAHGDITPQFLRQALEDAGIARRVVVVSACYSGGFISALQDDNTLVITASAADRASFGCKASNDFTDFGRAYFDDALRQTRSFTQAFELAKARIAAQEKADGREPSLPQMAGGSAAFHAQLQTFAGESGFQQGGE